MNLYLISQEFNSNYDTYDSAVVAAEDFKAASLTHPMFNAGWHERYEGLSTWAMPEHVTVRLIGEAAEGVVAGVICASFNAG